MKDRLSKHQVDVILKAFNVAIDRGPWDKSNFLKVIGKKLCELRDEFSNKINATSIEPTTETLAHRLALRSGQQQVFIVLYSSDGANIASWERILVNLPKQMVSRPVYAQEKDAKDIIKVKENKVNEAYVSFFVGPEDIMSLEADKSLKDKLGRGLLSLKDKSLRIENMNFFVHQSGVYEFIDGRLVKNIATDQP
ncbi:MAG: Dot/Icm secretion system protein IcmQ [Legionella sp.]